MAAERANWSGDIRVTAHPMPAHGERSASDAGRRLVWLDAARTVALLSMIAFHLVRDLEFFDAIPAGTTSQGNWAIFARTIAGSFIFLSGISLVIAHETDFRPWRWARRLAVISGAAALVTAASYLAVPEHFVYFGILHCVAASSVIGTSLLLAPAWMLLGLAALILVAAGFWGGVLFGSPWFAWTGLSSAVRPSLDFLPLVPWFAVFLVGMAVAKALPVSRWDLPVHAGAVARRLTWPGRHSLAVYLVHQPVLMSILWLVFLLAR